MPSPLDFLYRNNNEDEWAKRYVGNKMGIQQMQDGGESRQYSKGELSDYVEAGKQDYVDALKFWDKDTSLYDSLLKDVQLGNIVAQSLGEKDWFDKMVPGYIKDIPPAKNISGVFKSPKYGGSEEGSKDSIFIRANRQSSDEPATDKQILGHELAHYFTPHIAGFGFSEESFKNTPLYQSVKLQNEMAKKTTDEVFDERFFPIAEKYKDKIYSELKEKSEKMKKAGYKLPKGMQHGGPVFDPLGSNYDYKTAAEAGLERDERGHMDSLDPRTGMVLKGRGKYNEWNPMVQTEMSLGNTVEYDPDEGRYFSVPGGMYESAPADETAHDQMNNLIFENEMKQSQGASPFSFLNRDRIDSQNQELMDAVMSSSTPMMGATKIAPFSKNVFSMLSKILQQNKKANLIKELYESKSKYLKSGKGGGWSKDEVNTLLKRDKESYKEAGEVLYRNNLLKRAMKEYNEHRMVRPSTEINIKNIPKSAIEDPFDWM